MSQYHFNQEGLNRQQVPEQNNWNTQSAYPYTPPPAPPAPAPKKKKRRMGKIIGGLVLVLACGASGFGGSYLANQYDLSQGPTAANQAESGSVVPAVSADDLSVITVADKALDSVVSITTENLVFNPFVGNQVASGAGSGVIINADGTIITNNHVVEGAQNIAVTLQNGESYEAQLVGADPRSDIAVIQIEATGLVAATLGNSEDLAVGEFCLAIGNPMGTLGGTVTDGIISALDRELVIDGYSMDLLQMSAAVSPGNSGGGLFNARGDLIGIVNAKSGGSGAEGLGFAIPINTAMDVAQQLIEQGRVTDRPALGISVVGAQTQMGIQDVGLADPGVYVGEMVSGGAADQAGLEVGDKIVSINSVPVKNNNDISFVLNKLKVGDEVELVVARDDRELAFNLVLQELQE